jgi:hypothetical protein
MAPWAVQHQLCVSRPRPGQCPDATTRLRVVADVGMLRSVNFYSQEQIDNELAQIRIADWTYAPVVVEDWPFDAPMQPPLIPVTTTVGSTGSRVDIDDRTLSHLKVIVLTKLRLGEVFAFSWDKEPIM